MRTRQVERVLRLVADVREGDPTERRRHLCQGVLDIIGGRFSTVLEIEDFRAGGRGIPRREVIAGDDAGLSALLSVCRAEHLRVHPLARCMMETARTDDAPLWVVTRRDLVADEDWYPSPFVRDHLRAAGIDDGICAVRYRRASANVRGFAVVRAWGDHPFEPEDAALVHVLNAAADDLLDDDGPTGPQPDRRLTPREAGVLQLLLRGDSEKVAADRLGLSVHTIHQYTKAVFRAFGVSGRAELMAKFIPARAGRTIAREQV